MIKILDYDESPLIAGESRELILDGDGPFTVVISCFVDTPPPPGFRPCKECKTKIIRAKEPVRIMASEEFWIDKSGGLQVRITDSIGEVLEIEFGVVVKIKNQQSPYTAME